MKEGRMKGQAFITLPSEEKAKKALRDVHGYILHGKPMVIVSLTVDCLAKLKKISEGSLECYLAKGPFNLEKLSLIDGLEDTNNKIEKTCSISGLDSVERGVVWG